MKKLLPIIFLCLLFAYFSTLAGISRVDNIWDSLQKILKKPNNQVELIRLRSDCLHKKLSDSTYTQILQKIAENDYTKQNLSSAKSSIEEAIKLNKSGRINVKKEDLVENYFLYAKIIDEQGDYQKALDLYNQCLGIASIFYGKSSYIPPIYARKANIFTKMGDFEQAIVQTNFGIHVAEQSKIDSLKTKCLIERAKTFVITGKLKEAKDDLNNAIAILNNEKLSETLPYAYYWLAQLSSKEKKYQESIFFYQKAQKSFLKNNNIHNYSLNFIDIGMVHYNLKEYDKALESYNEGLKTMARPFVKVIILDDIAACYWMKKDYPKAFEYYQKALSIAPINFKSKNSFDNPTYKNLELADFKTYYLTTLTDKADTWLEYYQTTKQKENLKIALDTYVTADKLIDLMRFEHTGTQSKLYWRNKTHHLYVQAIETCFLLKNHEKAFYFFEKSKAVMLNDQLNELTAKQQLSSVDLAQEKGFQQKISELNKKLSSESETSKNYTNFQSQLVEEQNKQEAFIKRLERTNPTYFKYKYDTTMVSLDKVKKYLAKDQTVLEYFMGDDAIYALIISPENTDLQKIPLLDYSKNAKQFLIYCSDNQKINQNFQDFLLVSNQIYQQIFRYLNVPKGRLIITQDGYFLPFEALSKSSKRAEYLLNDYAISYTYSFQFLLKNLGENSFSFSHKFMGMSPVNYTKNLNQTSLSGSDISLSEVASNFVFGKKFSAKAATKNAFLSNAKDYKIVHLYTHAQADSSDQEPMIYFADSVLKLSELNALERFKTQLLVLSACKTAVGKNAKGEGILSLSRGFAALGIPATLTTLWSVENQSTYTLNELFYRYLSEGYPKDISLQKAKIEFLQSQSGEKQLPTFWAAAVLVGDAEAVSLGNGWVYLGIIVLLGLLGFWWFLKRKRRLGSKPSLR
jgi:CHAT domain-containing protein/tetratricopeptide (TPR) repeat protein